MSQPTAGSSSGLFKWVCLLVAVAALAAFGWMLNDVRLEVKSAAPKVEKLTDSSEQLVERANQTLPPILTHTERAARTIDDSLPVLLAHSEALLARSEEAVERLDRLGEGVGRYEQLMGVVHAGSQDKGMLAYGNSILDFLGGQKADVGVKAPAAKAALKHPVPAKQWSGFARKDVNFLSIVANTKGEMLRGLARTRSAAPLYLQVGEEAPQLLADWLSQNHPESKGVN